MLPRSAVDALLFDMDGVLYNADTPIAGAAEAVNWVRDRQIPHLFLTNTTSRPREALVEKLAGFGILSNAAEILTPAAAAIGWLARNAPEARLGLFVTELTRGEFQGFAVLPQDAETGADFVVIGDLAARWDFATLNRAFRLLQCNPAAELLALSGTKFWQGRTGLQLDVAPFTAALERATGRKARVFGKPSTDFFDAAVGQLGVVADRTLMIGDDIEIDIAGAHAAGLRAALVKTGKFRPEHLSGSVIPDLVLESAADLPRILGEYGRP